MDGGQLRGEEGGEYCREIEKPLSKVMHVANGQKADASLANRETGYRLLLKEEFACLLDTHIGEAYGGTGQVFNWQLAKEVSARFPVMVAGGLTPTNVGQMVREVQPWGVDVSSGVETDGHKNTAKIRDFIEAVRKAEGEKIAAG